MAIQLKITLCDVHEPSVWRRLLIPETYTFRQLHLAIQIAFGWEDKHLYEFCSAGVGDKWNVTEDDENITGIITPATSWARETKVLKFVNEHQISRFFYVYDFGDDWRHEVEIEELTNSLSGMPVCMDGEGAVPPEDCGGPGGYQWLKELKKKHKKTPEERQHLEYAFAKYDLFLDYDFDRYGNLKEGAIPDIYGWRAFRINAFNIKAVNREFKKMRSYESRYSFTMGDEDAIDLNATIERINRMEKLYNHVNDTVIRLTTSCEGEEEAVALARHERLKKSLSRMKDEIQALSDYLGSPDWWSDRAADEDGFLPDGLNRGVLGEDTIYNLLSFIDMVKRL